MRTQQGVWASAYRSLDRYTGNEIRLEHLYYNRMVECLVEVPRGRDVIGVTAVLVLPRSERGCGVKDFSSVVHRGARDLAWRSRVNKGRYGASQRSQGPVSRALASTP